MNYSKNKIRWHTGCYVIHDADEKSERMLMEVIEIMDDDLLRTKYINREGTQKSYINGFEVLHDPRRFNISIEGSFDCDIMSETLKRNSN